MNRLVRGGLFIVLAFLSSCTQETQNKINRSLQNWTGTNGVVDVVSAEGKVIYRWIKVDKLSTAEATGERGTARAYRFGYGYFDLNQNFIADENEKKVYFEVGDYNHYVFYESPFP
ncbi:MAG: hypothetical protein NT027_14960 [Proteobacteria bacterium]|nr:hypothetical protein [Pseudomonadota bacterium]